MPLYIGDYLADTMYLSTLEHGAYLLLLMAYWKGAGPIPSDSRKLATICRLSLSEFEAIRPALCSFFVEEDGVWRNNRADQEIKRWKQFKDGKEFGAAVTAHKRFGTPIPERFAERVAEQSAELSLSVSPSPSPLPIPSTSTPSSPASSHKGKVKSPAPAKPTRAKPEVDTELQALCKTVWHAYGLAYQDRYGAAPVRNAKINANVKGFCQRIPAADAPHVAAWYVGHNGQRYVAGGHVFGLMLQDAEKLRTEWATNRITTNSQARIADRTAGMGQVWKDLIEEARTNENQQAV